MDSDSQKRVDDDLACEKSATLRNARSAIQSFVSRLWGYRYWLLLPAWVLGCLLFYIFSNEPVPDRAKATVSFGASLGLLIIILAIYFHEIGSYKRYVHKNITQPVAFHLWRFRWLYVLVPVLLSALAGFNIVDVDQSETARERFISRAMGGATFGLMAAFVGMWPLSMLYSFAIRKVRWLIAVSLIPPLAFVFFFIG